MHYLKNLVATLGIIWAVVFSASQFAANMSTAFPPPPATTLSVPLAVQSCPR